MISSQIARQPTCFWSKQTPHRRLCRVCRPVSLHQDRLQCLQFVAEEKVVGTVEAWSEVLCAVTAVFSAGTGMSCQKSQPEPCSLSLSLCYISAVIPQQTLVDSEPQHRPQHRTQHDNTTTCQPRLVCCPAWSSPTSPQLWPRWP